MYQMKLRGNWTAEFTGIAINFAEYIKRKLTRNKGMTMNLEIKMSHEVDKTLYKAVYEPILYWSSVKSYNLPRGRTGSYQRFGRNKY